ncbi:hypothetical protein FA13DRAFT_1738957 [Coprinellus micaceus]|uniref:Uncharacterized protein n=1 Tax=Coprinellus micaceus TaxID=71717 RepID=A0A4Y7SSD4_COPMI|nr:hypothetical protein FA13DRAFT_1738957 [Coprinellus micaceus]
MDVSHSEQGLVTMPRPIVPDTQTRVKFTRSLMLLALLPLLTLEGNVILFNLFIVSLILNIAFLTALDLRMVLRQSATISPTRTLSQQAGEPTSYPLR